MDKLFSMKGVVPLKNTDGTDAPLKEKIIGKDITIRQGNTKRAHPFATRINAKVQLQWNKTNKTFHFSCEKSGFWGLLGNLPFEIFGKSQRRSDRFENLTHALLGPNATEENKDKMHTLLNGLLRACDPDEFQQNHVSYHQFALLNEAINAVSEQVLKDDIFPGPQTIFELLNTALIAQEEALFLQEVRENLTKEFLQNSPNLDLLSMKGLLASLGVETKPAKNLSPLEKLQKQTEDIQLVILGTKPTPPAPENLRGILKNAYQKVFGGEGANT